MHISDGILEPAICISGYAGAALLTAASLRKMRRDDISKVSVMSAVFFAVSLINFKIGFTSAHLVLIGLISIILGPLCVISFLTGLFFQAMMFGHGGITTLGVNTLVFSLPGMLIYFLAKFASSKNKVQFSIWAGFLSGLGVFIGAALIFLIIYFSDKKFASLAIIFSFSHAVLALGEGLLSGLVIYRLLLVKPEIIEFYQGDKPASTNREQQRHDEELVK